MWGRSVANKQQRGVFEYLAVGALYTIGLLGTVAMGFVLGPPAWIVAGILVISFSAYSIKHVETVVELDSLYVLRLQSREGSVKRLKAVLWMFLVSGVAWVCFWVYFAASQW